MIKVEDLVTGDIFEFRNGYAAKRFIEAQELLGQRKFKTTELQLIEPTFKIKTELSIKRYKDIRGERKNGALAKGQVCFKLPYLRKDCVNQLLYYQYIMGKLPESKHIISELKISIKSYYFYKRKIEAGHYGTIEFPRLNLKKVLELTFAEFCIILYFHRSDKIFKSKFGFMKDLKMDNRTFAVSISNLESINMLKIVKDNKDKRKFSGVVVEDNLQ